MPWVMSWFAESAAQRGARCLLRLGCRPHLHLPRLPRHCWSWRFSVAQEVDTLGPLCPRLPGLSGTAGSIFAHLQSDW